MFKRVLVAAGLVAALAAGGTAIAVAQSPQGGPGSGGPHMGGRRGGPAGPMRDLGLRGLDLTDAQREQVQKIMESHKAEFDQVRARLRDGYEAIAKATDAGTVDESAIRATTTTLASAMADEAILRAKVRSEVNGILTAEQLQKVQERKAEMQKRREGRRQQQ
jgi:protein CpxP